MVVAALALEAGEAVLEQAAFQVLAECLLDEVGKVLAVMFLGRSQETGQERSDNLVENGLLGLAAEAGHLTLDGVDRVDVF